MNINQSGPIKEQNHILDLGIVLTAIKIDNNKIMKRISILVRSFGKMLIIKQMQRQKKISLRKSGTILMNFSNLMIKKQQQQEMIQRVLIIRHQ